MSQLLRFEGYIPSSLLLVQTTEEQIHLVVQFLIRMVSWLLAIRTSTLMYGSLGQVPLPPVLSCDAQVLYQKYEVISEQLLSRAEIPLPRRRHCPGYPET